MNLFEQLIEAFEIIEPGSTKTQIYVDESPFGLKVLIKEFLEEEEKKEKKEKITVEDLIAFEKFAEEKDLSNIIIPFREGLLKTIDRAVAAYSGKAIFFADHHHIYQPDRYDPLFADYIHEKICKECYNSMTSVYQYYSVNVGPTLLEWFRRKRPDLMEKLHRANKREPVIGQTYTHRILPLIRNEEDLEVEITAGIKYRDFIFGPLEKGRYRGIWIPECTIGIREAKCLARHGIDFVILREDQSAYFVNTGKPYKLSWEEEDGTILELMVFYYHTFSKDLSFDKWTTDNPDHTINHLLKNIPYGNLVLLAHDGELVHHRWEHCNVDVSGFFKELPIEIYRKSHPIIIMTTPARYIKFLKLKSSFEEKSFTMNKTDLPDFPTSWSCGGYQIKTFYSLKGINVEDLIRSSDNNIIRYYSEMLILRKLQGKNVDPVDDTQWEYLLKEQIKELEEKEELPLSDERKYEIKKDLYRGVNVCYDIRRFNKSKVGGAGRWAFGSLDSGDSDYQTFLRESVMLLEDNVIELFSKKVKPCIKNIIEAKSDFIVYRMDELKIPEDKEKKISYLKRIYPAISAEKAMEYPSKEEFFRKHLNSPSISEEEEKEIWILFYIWSYMRKAYTSCAYYFDDFNNHVAEDAVIRATEAVFLLEDNFNIKLCQDFFEKLEKCKSRYRPQRKQGPNVTAARIARIHMNILKLQKNISSLEKIKKHEFIELLKNNEYDLPHPSAEGLEYYRAFVNDNLVGFTSNEGLETLISKTSREVSRKKEPARVIIEKRDLITGDIISRFQIDVTYTQLEREKPYINSSVDKDILISNKIEEKLQEQAAYFYVNNIKEYLPVYGVDKVITAFIDPEKIILECTENKDRRKGPKKGAWEITFREEQEISSLTNFSSNLRFIKKEIKNIEEDIPGIKGVSPHGLEKFYKHLNRMYEYLNIKEIVYEENGLNMFEQYFEENDLSIKEGLEKYMEENPDAFPKNHKRLVYSLLMYRLFKRHDKAIGSYELEEKHRKKRDLTLKEAVSEYCKENNIPYIKEIYAHKLWKYQKDKVKHYRDLLDREEKAKNFLASNIIVKKPGKKPVYTMVTNPIVYVHGAANEQFFEGFYPDNEAIPEIAKRNPHRKVSLLFIPGGRETEGQIQYFRKMQRYLLEKFNLTEVKAGIYACGSQKKLEDIMKKEKISLDKNEIFLLPSLEGNMTMKRMSKKTIDKFSSKNLKFDKEKELKKFENYLRRVDIVYLGGGDPRISGLRQHHLKLPGGKSFKRALKDFVLRGGLLMGVSAGAMVMGIENVSYRVKLNLLEGKLKGLELFPANIQVHYEEYGIPEHIMAVREDYPDIPVTAIDTQTAILGSLNFKITFSESPGKKEGWNNIKDIKLLKEDFTVLGSKTVTFEGEVDDLLFDGMKCPEELSWKRLLDSEE